MPEPRDHTRGLRKAKFNLTSRRLREIENLIRYRNTKNGRLVMPEVESRPYLLPIAQHLRRKRLERGTPPTLSQLFEQLKYWAGRWLPTVSNDTLKQVAIKAMSGTGLEKANVLGARLQLTDHERTYLKITTIAPFDISNAERKQRSRQRRRERDKLRATKRRREHGALPREKFLANSLTATRPWEAEGTSRKTWERRRKQKAG